MALTTTNTAPPVHAAPADRSNPAMHGSPAEHLLVVVAPANGRFVPVAATGFVAAGGVVGQLTIGKGRTQPVHSPADVVLRGLLARTNQLVTAGSALAWGVRAGWQPA